MSIAIAVIVWVVLAYTVVRAMGFGLGTPDHGEG